jgi:glycerate kinase
MKDARMKIVVASDSFKDCLGARAVCETMAAGVREALPEAEIVCVPLADGGEGTADVLMQAMGGQRIVKLVNGPLPGKRVKAGYIWCEQDRIAIVEMAQASGLQRLKLKDRHPLETTSLGTGQLILAAVKKGAQRILLTVGGSATVDLGIGMASALGWQFLGHQGETLEPVGSNLLKVQKIVPPKEPWRVPVEVLCDVTNPLLGYHGAAQVFAPQKGATRGDVVLLEVGLTQVVSVIKEQFAIDIQGIPGGGAAGGLAAGARVFLNATLVRGIDQVLERTGFQGVIQDADWVITGEGRLDMQSLGGKVVSGVTQACQRKPAKVAVFAGQVDLSEEVCQHHGIDYAMACTPHTLSKSQSLKKARTLIKKAVTQWAETLVAR